MPSVSVTSPQRALHELTTEQAQGVAAGSVSAAVHTLTIHGYRNIRVVDESGNEIAMREWDTRAIVELVTDGDRATITAV